MELQVTWIILPQTVTVTVPAGATTGTVGTNNPDNIDEANETFTIASWNSFATGTINV
jgi:hypothetical protein